MKKVVLVFIFITIINLYAEDLLDLIYKMNYEIANYSFNKAKFYNDKVNSSDKFVLISKKLTEYELQLYQRKHIPEKNLIKLRKAVKKIIKWDRRDYLKETLKRILNEISVLSLANTFYKNEQHLDKKGINELLKIYNYPPDKRVSFHMIAILPYLLYANGYKSEGLDAIKVISLEKGLTELEREYLIELNLIMYLYIDGSYSEAMGKINKLLSKLSKNVTVNYYHYIKCMPYLWQSLIYYKENNITKAISSYKKFLELKKIIDQEYKFYSSKKQLLSPVPGVFPPKKVYADFEAISELYKQKTKSKK